MPQTQAAEPAGSKYRPDIDGLRAIAVVPVVLYHYRIPGFGGGFVGVDVFFAISGYLITTLIYSEIVRGDFSIVRFYERRVRRIFPALFAVMAVTLIAATFILFPRDLLALAQSTVATVLFVSNFDFWAQSGYFDVGAELKPLLHTWSLAVEEQFYLVFPALLYLLHTRRRSSVLTFVVVLALASFVLSVWSVRRYPDAAFYLAPQRFWELMVGAILALGKFPVPRAVWLAEACALAGIAAIAWSVFAFSEYTRFPGEAALLPCIGTGLVIYAGEQDSTYSSRALSWPPLVFVGLISYSLYLWHWPLYVFAKYLDPGPLGTTSTVALIALSFGFAVASWRFVERPFRGKRGYFTRPRLFRVSVYAMLGIMAVAGLIFGLRGLPQRFSPSVQRLLAEANDAEPRRHQCFNRTPDEVERGDFCTVGDARARTATFLLWGDSHADSLLPAVEEAAGRAHRKGYFIGHGRCPPLLQLQLSEEPSKVCARLNDDILRVVDAANIKVVILVARWAYYDQGSGYGPDRNEERRVIDLEPGAPAGETQHQAFARILARTVLSLRQRDKTVVLVNSLPEIAASVPEALARLSLQGRQDAIGPTLLDYRARQRFVGEDLSELAKAPGVRIVDPSLPLCASGRCLVVQNGRPLYTDHQHLSVFGARSISRVFDCIF